MDFLELWGNNGDLHLDSSIGPSVKVNGMELSSPELRGNIARFFCQPWWGRLWTVQEFILAKKIFFQSGRCTLSGDLPGKCVQHLRKHTSAMCCTQLSSIMRLTDSQTGLCLMDAMSKPNLLEHARFNRFHRPFYYILQLFRHLECTDPRDKIYDMLNLAIGPYMDLILPDYTRSLESVLTLATISIVERSQSLHIFSLLHYGRRNLTKLPSFVPDLTESVLLDANRLEHTDRVEMVRLFRASGDSKSDLRLVSTTKASTSGFIFDSVSAVGIPLGASSLENWRTLAQVDDDPDASYPQTDVSRETAFWQTLCGGSVGAIVRGEYEFEGVDDRTGYQMYQQWIAWVTAPHDSIEQKSLTSLDGIDFNTAYLAAAVGHRFFVTQNGYFGLAPATTSTRDYVTILAGGPVPYILRPVSDEVSIEYIHGTATSALGYRILGDAYVHGIMDGELSNRKFEDIVLV
ncbi:uncharacterized protein BDZ99DRAFT_519929 [Mytilinidion resinicola]|uniref:Heterokaryon incompatibility domain-containing protein n=1 Tax=Mytilinidion resinicola TaxID=574789 RepID=A0A6A6YRY9_9PEZI|nr:uncharacterized protein BDZ99DRAFT_519929 [Mytilinidion resinicola]KAF2811279.1 hypothetical protein BDZ99DRAFT_519929 [Mytilinidion resinicola]